MRTELISPDNSFLYAFGCYACSYAPTRIHKLLGTDLKDVTMDGRYRAFLRGRLREMEANARSSSADVLHSNGYLGGWVAAKALVGELSDAWRTMLLSYDRNSDWQVAPCRKPLSLDQCPESETQQLDFPETLADHLLEHGYITPSEKGQLDFSPSRQGKINSKPRQTLHPSTPLGSCSTAIDDPLRPMIIDQLISGGKHIAPDWTTTIKNEIENDYGSLVKVLNDATVERVDEHTGKVGCAVTYEVDLQGLAQKVLQLGANARAQILIRQIAREGKSISRRLQYTVQRTSGGSIIVSFGLAMDASSRRRTAQCVLFYGGRCVMWR